jgi:hypothetical protein
MPAYAKDGSVVCFFQSAQKFKAKCAVRSSRFLDMNEMVV